MYRTALLSVVFATSATIAAAQNWPENMFKEKAHDFGAVARAAKVEYPFVVTNTTKDEIHISSVRSSCGCTSPRIVKETLKPGESSEIIAAFNTRAFTGQRSARVTVTIDRPRYAEVQLDVKGYIRTDVVLNPSLVNFGAIPEGKGADKKVQIEYAGRNDWQITSIKPNSEFVTATVKETARANGRVSYELDVRLKDDAPRGYVNDQIILQTNDRRATQFPVTIEGRIEAELAVSPSPLLLGTLQPGQTVTKQVVIKGVEPFTILDISSDDSSAFRFTVPTEAKTVHLIPITFMASNDPGKVTRTIEIKTDMGGGKTTEFSVVGQIAAPLAGK